jgi:hypothetical protein
LDVGPIVISASRYSTFFSECHGNSFPDASRCTRDQSPFALQQLRVPDHGVERILQTTLEEHAFAPGTVTNSHCMNDEIKNIIFLSFTPRHHVWEGHHSGMSMIYFSRHLLLLT